MVTNRKEYMRQYMREYRARKRIGLGRTHHLACDRQIAELRGEIDELRRRIREYEEIDAWGR